MSKLKYTPSWFNPDLDLKDIDIAFRKSPVFFGEEEKKISRKEKVTLAAHQTTPWYQSARNTESAPSLIEQVAKFHFIYKIKEKNEDQSYVTAEVYANQLENTKLDKNVKRFFLLRHLQLMSNQFLGCKDKDLDCRKGNEMANLWAGGVNTFVYGL